MLALGGIAAFVLLASLSIRLPGLYYDELFQLTTALAFVKGGFGSAVAWVPGTEISLAGHPLPLMAHSYIGAVKTIAFVPVAAVDLSEEALMLGRELAEERHVANVRFERADVTKPLGTSEYDAVAALECLLEIEEDEAAVASFAAALRPGGLFVAHVPERSWKPLLRSSRPAWKLEVRHGYGRDEIVSLLERAGLQVERVTPTTRGTLQLAEELRDRVRHAHLAVRAATLPLVRAALALERARVTWGPPRGFYVEARKPL